MKIGVQCESIGTRCGIYTYASRVNRYLNELDDVESYMFIDKFKHGKMDILNIQYEPGMMPPNRLVHLLQKYETESAILTVHHKGLINQFYPMIDGAILHANNQVEEKPWSYKVIPHPALVYKEKDKAKLRKKFNLPKDKKIIGTMGFIYGTGKLLPLTVEHLLKNMKDDEFLYLITSFWKGGDGGRLKDINDVVDKLGKKDNFRIDVDYVADEEILNEKMQCCDLMYAWNNISNAEPGSQSGSAADMYGARVKLVVKDCPHYSFIGKQEGVVVGREKPEEFVEDVLRVLREEDLDNVPDPTWLSWEEQIKNYVDYFHEVLGD